jgi:Zn-dependent protease
MDEIQKILIMALPLILAVTLHEAAHAYVADRKGDATARLLGRVSLNPIVHIDLFGTILIPFLLFTTTGSIFGYAKPVPVNPFQLHRPKQDMAWVALAGPGMNLCLAVVSGLLYRAIEGDNVLSPSGSNNALIPFLLMMLSYSVMINLWLMAFNLIPIPPLDGGRVLAGFLPEDAARFLLRAEPYGMVIITALVFLDPFGLIPRVLHPIVYGVSKFIFSG